MTGRRRCHPGPPPKSVLIRVELQGNSQQVTQDEVRADGTARHNVYSYILDGKSHPVKNRAFDEMIVTRVDANTLLIVAKKEGAEVLSQRIVVSNDGQSQTVDYIQKEGNGRRALHNISVFDKE
jgi:hypothetical protein